MLEEIDGKRYRGSGMKPVPERQLYQKRRDASKAPERVPGIERKLVIESAESMPTGSITATASSSLADPWPRRERTWPLTSVQRIINERFHAHRAHGVEVEELLPSGIARFRSACTRGSTLRLVQRRGPGVRGLHIVFIG